MIRPLLLLLLCARPVLAGIDSTKALADRSNRSTWSADRGRALGRRGDDDNDDDDDEHDHRPRRKPPPPPPHYRPPHGCDGYSPGQIISYDDAKACTVSARHKVARGRALCERPSPRPAG